MSSSKPPISKTVASKKPNKKGVKAAIVEDEVEDKEPVLSDAESKIVRDAFNKVDIDHNGTLDGDELRKFFLELRRPDLDADRDLDEIRRIGSKRKNKRILDTDRVDLRACLVFFAHKPRPTPSEVEDCSKALFSHLYDGEKNQAAEPSTPRVMTDQLSALLRDEYDLDIDLGEFVKGAENLSLEGLEDLLTVDTVQTTPTTQSVLAESVTSRSARVR